MTMRASRCKGIALPVVLVFSILVVVFYTTEQDRVVNSDTYVKAKYDNAPPVPEDRFTDRKELLRRVCSEANTTNSPTLSVTAYKPANLSVCVVNKAGSTTWLRLFAIIENTNKQSQPKQVLSDPSWLRSARYNFDKQRDDLFEHYRVYDKQNRWARSYTKVLTSRNPYTRLWSAYVSKFHIPMFTDLGRKIIQKFRPNATAKERKCGHDVTFAEFIKYVIAQGHFKGLYSSHWLPVSDLCEPCGYKPDLILKQESLKSDLNATQQELGLAVDLGEFFSSNQDENIMKDELDGDFKGFWKVGDCINKTEYLGRVWTQMVVNGYILDDENTRAMFVKAQFDFSTAFNQIVDLRMRLGVDKQMRDRLRQQALVHAYQQISDEDLEALQELYKYDFLMFNYDSTPPV